MNKINDVTNLVEIPNNYEENISLTKCICGEVFNPGEFMITSAKSYCYTLCPCCGARLYFQKEIKVFQVL